MSGIGSLDANALWRVELADGTERWAVGSVDAPQELLEGFSLDEALAVGNPLGASIDDHRTGDAMPTGAVLLAPVQSQEVWASGVTYRRSLEARRVEAQIADSYDRVYLAERPELFFKAGAGKSRGSGEPVAIRADSTWNVPEPELVLVANAAGELVAYCLGNDMSSRDIEGENPLYLPQAKVYTGSCAVGPCLVPVGTAPTLESMVIQLRVFRADDQVVAGQIALTEMQRPFQQLLSYLFRSQDFPSGVLLMTGAGVVPEDSFTLAAGDVVEIAMEGLGVLRNPVQVVA